MNEENDVTDGEIYQTFELSDGCRSVTIIASMEEEEKIHQDQEYASERFLSALSEINTMDEGDFTHNATLLLIECIRDRFEKFCASRFERNQVYREVQEELHSYSYNMSIEKIRNKWSNLVTTYKRIKLRQRTCGLGRRVWEYYQELDELLSPSFESSTSAKVSVNMIKAESVDTQEQNAVNELVIKLEEKGDTSFGVTNCPQLQPVTSALNSTPSSQVKRKYEESFNNQDNYSEKEKMREELLEQFMQQITEKETKEYNYKKRKERRDRMKLKTLQKIVSKLETVSKTQGDILKKQESVLGTIIQSKNKNS